MVFIPLCSIDYTDIHCSIQYNAFFISFILTKHLSINDHHDMLFTNPQNKGKILFGGDNINQNTQH